MPCGEDQNLMKSGNVRIVCPRDRDTGSGDPLVLVVPCKSPAGSSSRYSPSDGPNEPCKGECLSGG